MPNFFKCHNVKFKLYLRAEFQALNWARPKKTILEWTKKAKNQIPQSVFKKIQGVPRNMKVGSDKWEINRMKLFSISHSYLPHCWKIKVLRNIILNWVYMALFKWKIELEIMFEFPLYNLDLGSNIEMVTFFLIEQKFSRSNEIFREKEWRSEKKRTMDEQIGSFREMKKIKKFLN